MDILTVVRELNAGFGPSGQEEDIRNRIANLAPGRIDERTMDALGNLILRRKGNGPKVMFAAHMDSIGIIATHIEEDGFVRFSRIGGVHTDRALHAPVRFENGTTGTIASDTEVETGKRTLDDLFIDIGARDRSEALERISIGDTAIYDTPIRRMGGRIASPYLDNRISCAALLKAMGMIEDSPNDLYFVFTVQEEPGLRGAKPAAFAIEPDYAIVCDVTNAADLPGKKRDGNSRLGGGAAIKIMDRAVLCHPDMVKRLQTLAEERNIPTQNDVFPRGGTDGGPIHVSRTGVRTGGVSVPCRYIHAPQEVVELSDVEHCVALFAAFAKCELPALR